jgi:phage terminase large subunit-like protein
MSWSTACPDWEHRLLHGLPLVPELPIFRREADRALRIFNRLRLPDVIGTPAMAEASGEWFRAIVAVLFGSYDPLAHRRMIQEYFLVIPKKNAKSSNGGAVMVVALIVNRRPEAEFLLVAPTKEIADIAFKQASGTIKIDPELEKLFHIQRHIRLISHRRTGATLQIKAADTDVITGSKALGTMIDETHVFAKRPRAAEVFVELRGALAARPDGFLFQTTTQSKEPPTGVFKAELQMARDVRDGRIALPLLAIIYELPNRLAKDGGWKNPAYWPLVNPNMGRSVDEQFLTREVMKAEGQGSHALALIASQHFNVEVGLSLMSDRWAGAEFWERRGDPGLSRAVVLARSEVVVIGIDGGGLDDLFGVAVLGRDRETKEWLLWSHAWCHRGVLERRKSIASRLLEFQAAGDLTIVEDELGDVSAIVAIVAEVRDAGVLGSVAVDPAGLGEFVDAMAEIDVTQENKLLVGVGQGYRMMNAIKTTERRLASGMLRHGGSALMAWCVGNLKIEPTATAIRATKQNAGDAKIDPAMAMFDAVDIMTTSPDPRGGPSIYDTISDEGLLMGVDSVRKPAPGASSHETDRAILADPSHPSFAEAKQRFEDALDAADEEDGY